MTTHLTQHSPIDTTSAEALNRDCFCRTLNSERLREQLERDPTLQGMMATLQDTRPNLFSSTVVFISLATHQQIVAAVNAIERVVALPSYQNQALARADGVAQRDHGPRGVCMGYDFHLSASGPQLIEINTNAGGLLLNVALASAQEACCDELQWVFPSGVRRETLRQTVVDMFRQEWQLQRGAAALRSVVIVDETPSEQYLAPEFELFRQLFTQHGIRAQVAAPSELLWDQGQLLHHGQPADLVYNRLTDFHLSDPAHLSLRLAYESGGAVVTPHPRAHALFADKRNLIALCQPELLASWGVPEQDRAVLAACVPTTRLVTPELAPQLWAQRRQLFFKPVAGYGAKAAYRGDKLTRRVWDEILQGDFVAQALVAPSGRSIEVDGIQADLKFDIRAYTYQGQVQLLAARMYSGQTTNFRTQGGGFAPVICVPGTLQTCPGDA